MNMTPSEWAMIPAALFSWGTVAAAALITPRISRPDMFFAVTVHPSFRGSLAGRGIQRSYDRSVVALALISLLPVAFARSRIPWLGLAGMLAPMAVETAGWIGVFVAARKRTLPHRAEPSAEREAELLPRRVSLPGGWLAQAGPFLILGIVCLWLGLRWDGIPARMPIHWNLAGNPDGWSAKNPIAVFGSAIIGLLICSMLLVLWRSTMAGVRRIHGAGPEAIRSARFTRAMALFILGIEYWIALLMSLIGLAALRPDPTATLPAFWPILAAQTLLVASIFAIAYRTGQGGWRLGMASTAESAEGGGPPVGDRTPDACWKLGMIYFNRDDPALFVEKRFGVGWTMNMANPKAGLVLGGILLIAAASIAVSILIVKGGVSAGSQH